MDELPIGRRVAYWRGRRKMSQQVFADRLGKSKSWVDKVERGIRRLDKFTVVYEIADVLQVDVQLLLGREAERRPDGAGFVDPIEVEEVRAAIERYQQMDDYFRPSRAAPPPLPGLRQTLDHAWLTYQHAKYGALVRMLPRLLGDAQAAAGTRAGGADGDDTTRLLSEVWQVTSAVMRKAGETELASMAADRAMSAAYRGGDPLLIGVSARLVAASLLAAGRIRPAMEISMVAANRLADSGDPARLAVYGALLLQGALAAARIGDKATARELLDVAAAAAGALGRDATYYWTSFGPTEVVVHRVAASVELGDGEAAVRAHAGLAEEDLSGLAVERQAAHLIELARASVQLGEPDRAAEFLLRADRLAPSEIRARPFAREVVKDVVTRMRHPGSATAELQALVEELGPVPEIG
ncbi:helix-turn-helix domain-containing protein [Actinoplanes sp. NPDC048796]|uniref:helix-turn-helix domain-containing protein n=1 Tax=Actinoplanes sp. NPDC048796 TaxID=3155640 RepID=UPI0033FE0624